MRVLLLIVPLCALAVGGCARGTGTASPAAGSPRARAATAPGRAAGTNSGLIVTPDKAVVGKVVLINPAAGHVVISFPLGKVPGVDQRLNLYRRGLKVGEVKVTGPQREDNTVADLAAGEAEVGDEARSQ